MLHCMPSVKLDVGPLRPFVGGSTTRRKVRTIGERCDPLRDTSELDKVATFMDKTAAPTC
jgi:hypothetical protein